MKWSTKQRYRTYDSYSENDLESLQIMHTLTDNLAWLMKNVEK